MSQKPVTLHLLPVGSPAPKNTARLRLVSEPPLHPDVGSPGDADAGLSDSQLVILLRSGDSYAFERLYRRHAAFAINLAVRVQGSASDVEDLVHDAFLRSHERIGDLREPSAYRSWLGSIVVMLVRGRLRRRRLLGSLGMGHGDPIDLEAIASVEASPESRAQLAQVYALLQTLPTDERIAWTLRVIEKQPLEQVAQLSNCSLATAKRRISRAQKFFAEHFVSPLSEHQS